MSEFDKQESDFIQFLRRLPFDDAPRPEHGAALREQVLRKFDQAIARRRRADRGSTPLTLGEN
jgi:hypothetical protein